MTCSFASILNPTYQEALQVLPQIYPLLVSPAMASLLPACFYPLTICSLYRNQSHLLKAEIWSHPVENLFNGFSIPLGKKKIQTFIFYKALHNVALAYFSTFLILPHCKLIQPHWPSWFSNMSNFLYLRIFEPAILFV